MESKQEFYRRPQVEAADPSIRVLQEREPLLRTAAAARPGPAPEERTFPASPDVPPAGLFPEQLADALDDAHPRRPWWIELHTNHDHTVGTTFSDLTNMVAAAETRSL